MPENWLSKPCESEKLYEVVTVGTIGDKVDQRIVWPVLAPNQRAALDAGHYLAGDSGRLVVLASPKWIGAASISKETIDRIRAS